MQSKESGDSTVNQSVIDVSSDHFPKITSHFRNTVSFAT